MSEITRTENRTDGSTTIAAVLDVADLVKADRSAVNQLEISMREALEVITGAEDKQLPSLRRRQTLLNIWGAFRAFVILVIVLVVVVAMIRVLIYAASATWDLI